LVGLKRKHPWDAGTRGAKRSIPSTFVSPRNCKDTEKGDIAPNLAISLAELSRRSGLSLSAVNQSVKRAEELANARGYRPIKAMKLQK
jgi:hypothetical protein